MGSGEKGQATLELALCLPFLALLLTALVEIGLVVGDQARLWHAAREAARAAIVDPDPSAARAAAERTGLDGVSVSIDPVPAQRVSGEPLTVSLIYEPDGRIPLIGELVSRVALRAEATMRIERP